MNHVVTTIDGHTNAAYLALEILKDFQERKAVSTINDESFYYVATQIPDFSEEEPSYDINTMEDLTKYALDHGFVIEQINGVIEAATKDNWRDAESLNPEPEGIDGFDALAHADSDGS